MSERRSILVRNEGDVINARLQTRQMAKEAGLQILDQARISLAVSSMAHIISLGEKYEGQIIIDCVTDSDRSGVQVVWNIIPNGDTAHVLEALDQTAWMLMVDNVDIVTTPEAGICITAVKWAENQKKEY